MYYGIDGGRGDGNGSVHSIMWCNKSGEQINDVNNDGHCSTQLLSSLEADGDND